jgi:SH3-like domain-containing protein
MRVWAEPDPAATPIAQFEEATPVRVEEERGAWARITRADGWGGWADGRRLEPVHPEVRPAAATAAARVATEVIPQVAPVAWAPTHEVPPGGMAAYAEPDPQLQPVARLQERVQLRVDEQRGAWARVTGSNGWTGWVDGRRLAALGSGAVTAPMAAVPSAASGFAVKPVTLVGAVLAVVAVFLPWVNTVASTNGFDWPLSTLWDYNALAGGSGFSVGAVVLILGIASFVPSVLRGPMRGAAIVLGTLLLLIGVLFVVQVVRYATGVNEWSVWKGLTDGVRFGAWAAIAGGLLAMVGGIIDR